MSETDEHDSCSTGRLTPNSLVSGQPSEAELAYAPVYHTAYVMNDANQVQPGYDLPQQLPITYLQDGYATDTDGNVYAVQYMTTDPPCNEQPPPHLDQKNTNPNCWPEQSPEIFPSPRIRDQTMSPTNAFPNNCDMAYPITTTPDQVHVIFA